jgi:hypothetical protein
MAGRTMIWRVNITTMFLKELNKTEKLYLQFFSLCMNIPAALISDTQELAVPCMEERIQI